MANERVAGAPVIKSNLKQYTEHRKKLRNAKPLVDDQPVVLHINDYVRLSKIPQKAEELISAHVKNKTLLIDLIHLYLNPGYPKIIRNERTRSTRLLALQKSMRKIEEENIHFANRLQRAWCTIPARALPPRPSKIENYVPAEILQRFCFITELPRNIQMQYKIFRPKVYFDLEAKHERSFGRMVFQLFTESCPVLVLEFVRFCASGLCEKMRFPRLYSSLWAEGEMIVEKRELDCLEYYDMKALDYGPHAGVLCFALQDFNILKLGVLAFTISFRPLTVNDGKRFPFGKIIKGRKRFLCLHDYSTKSGRANGRITVNAMGVL